MPDVATQIDEQIEFLHLCRSTFPHLSDQLVGAKRFPTAPYYRNKGMEIFFEFSSPLTQQFIDQFNDLGHWINQNFVLRLFAVMESNGLISETICIRTEIEGHEELDILRRLRQKFAHGSSSYDPADPEKKKLYDRIVSHFNLDPNDYPEKEGKYPIPIDRVLIPLSKACRRYALAAEGAA
jgi:hypothetical protein